MYQYPYGDTQQLNLDWLLEQWQETRDSIDNSLQAEIDRVEAAISDLLTARDEAVAAQTAAETAATSASGYAGTASGAASTATAQATAAAASAALAGTHASNAQTSETNAGLQATAAGNSASAAAVSEGNARNSELAAAASSSAAAGNALYAEGMAKGTQNGTPVTSGSPYYENNAAYWAGYAEQDAEYAEAMAKGTINGTPVASGEPGYEDNAKYYKDQAAAQAAAAAASAASADGAAAQAMIAIIEPSTTASVDHAKGSYFINNGFLYIATTDIASGATITPGTNCKKAVLADDIETLAAQNNIIYETNSNTVALTGTRCGTTSASFANAKATELFLMLSIPAGTYNEKRITVETSAFTSNGTAKYEQAPLPALEDIPFKDEGIYIAVHTKLIGNIVISDIIVQSKTTRQNTLYFKKISIFNAEIKYLRSTTIWHYAASTTPATLYWKTNAPSVYNFGQA